MRISDVAYANQYPNSSLDIYTSDSDSEERPIDIYVHGGGFVGDGEADGDPFAANGDRFAPTYAPALEAGYNLVSVGYAFAPQYTYPTPLLQLTNAVQFLQDHGQDYGLSMDRVVLGGDSAGGQLVYLTIFRSALAERNTTQASSADDRLRRGRGKQLGNDLDRLGITVLSVEGKGGLQTTLSILTNLGIPTYAMADGDFGTASRKAGKSDADKANAHATHRRQTEDLIRALPTSAAASYGSLPASFGGASVVSDKFAIWADDLEEELGSWNSFGLALAASGIDLAARNNKNQLAYRNAVFDASKEDLPESLAILIAQIVKMSSHSMSTDQSATVSAINEGTS